jgi:hypothetical protein
VSEAAKVELADVPLLRLREALGGELPLEGGLMNAVARSQQLLTYLQTPPILILHLDKQLVRLGDFSFRLSSQLMAVYAFFLLRFNGPDSLWSIEDLFSERLLLTRLERYSDSIKQGEKESYAWERMKDIEDFKGHIRPCFSKINRAVGAAFGKNLLSTRYSIHKGRGYGVSVERFVILKAGGAPWDDKQQ